MNEFDDIVDTTGLSPDEADRYAACTSCSWKPGRRPICRRHSRSPPILRTRR